MPPLIIREEYLAIEGLTLSEAAFLSEVKNLHLAGGCFGRQSHFALRCKCSTKTIRAMTRYLIDWNLIVEDGKYLVPQPVENAAINEEKREEYRNRKGENVSAKRENVGGENVSAKTATVSHGWENVSVRSITRNKQESKQENTPPTPKNPKRETPWSLDYGFETFWKSYPRKNDKAGARAEWLKLKPSAELCAEITKHVELRAHSPEWTEEDGRYIPYGVRFIRKRRWEDQGVKLPQQSRSSDPTEWTTERMQQEFGI